MTKPQAISVTAPVNEDLPKEKFDELEALLIKTLTLIYIFVYSKNIDRYLYLQT